MVTTLDAVDVVIAGAGICGTMLAAKLATAGKTVVVLEQGPNRAPSDLISSQLWSRRLKWNGLPVELAGTDPTGYRFNTGWGVGGSGIHHYAQWPRLKPEDFHTKTLYGKAVDWPIEYNDLRPFYDKVQAEVGISGDHQAEIWRPPGDPYPMPPLLTTPQADILAKGFTAIGLRTAPMPLAINSTVYKGRPACIYDGWCDAGCPIGALANPFVTYLPTARQAGAEFRTSATVTRVLTDRTGKRAAALEYYDATGHLQIQSASLIILAANGTQNVRLLLNSARAGHENGLANRSGTVGLYFMAHLAMPTSGMFDQDLQNDLGVTGGALLNQDGYGKHRPNGPFGSYAWAISSARKPNDIIGLANTEGALFGPDYDRFLKNAARGLATMMGIGEITPRPENRITYGDGKDAFGYPAMKIVLSADNNAKALAAIIRAEGIKVMKAAGASQIWAPDAVNWQHLVGGHRMGADRRTSVCDSYGITHDLPNLVLTGTGIFPTEGATHPTFSSHALTQRTAEYLVKNWSGIA